jgi:hypothetical protein
MSLSIDSQSEANKQNVCPTTEFRSAVTTHKSQLLLLMLRYCNLPFHIVEQISHFLASNSKNINNTIKKIYHLYILRQKSYQKIVLFDEIGAKKHIILCNKLLIYR